MNVSIVIPTFNRADKVCKAIDSALAQSYESEVIIVDHGSSDNTSEVVKKYGDKIKYIHRDKDFGPHFCWLEGVMHAQGKFIHIQYDDDWIAPQFIEECLKMMNEDVGMVFTDAVIYDLQKNKERNICHHFMNGKAESGIYLSKKLEKELVFSRHKLISPGACLFRKRDLIDSLYQGSLPVKTIDDYHGVGPDLLVSLIAILRYKNFGYIKTPLAYFGAHDGSITVDAFKNEEKGKKLIKAYNEVRIFYLSQKNLYLIHRLIFAFKNLRWNKIIKLKF